MYEVAMGLWIRTLRALVLLLTAELWAPFIGFGTVPWNQNSEESSLPHHHCQSSLSLMEMVDIKALPKSRILIC